MADFSRTGLEEAALKALEAELPSEVKTLRRCQGEWLTELEREGWRLPAVLLRLSQSRGEQVGVRSYDLTLDLTLLAIGSGVAALRPQENEIYPILGGIRQALWHQDLGLEILPLALVKEEPLSDTGDYRVYEVVYRTVVVQDF